MRRSRTSLPVRNHRPHGVKVHAHLQNIQRDYTGFESAHRKMFSARYPADIFHCWV